MGNRYRFTLGYKRVSGDLLAGISRTGNVGGGQFLEFEYQNVVFPGRIYQSVFEQIGIAAYGYNQGVGVGFGEFNFSTGLNLGFISRWLPADNGFYTYENVCLEGNNFLLAYQYDGVNHKDIQNAELYEMGWNDPLSVIPVGWDESKIELKRDAQDFAQIEKYTSALKFVGDGYDYLRSVFVSEGSSAIVPVKIEKLVDWCSPYASDLIYEQIYTGVIYLNKSIFDEPKRVVEASLEDSSAGAVLATGKQIDIDINTYDTTTGKKMEHCFLGDKFWQTALHDTIGGYPSNKIRDGMFRVFSVFKAIVRGFSEGKVDFRSNFFNSGDYEWLMMSRGDLMYKQIAGGLFDSPITFQFDKLFKEQDKKFNLGIGFEIDGIIPVIRVEPKSYFEALSTKKVEFDSVRTIAVTAPKEIDYRILKIGYKNKWDKINETNLDIGWILYYSSKNVADATLLDLVSEDVVETEYLHYIIEQSVTGDSADVDDSVLLFECFFVGGATPVKSTQVTTAEFNHTLHPEDNFNRWKPNLPKSLFGATNADRSLGGELRNKMIKFSAPITFNDFNKLVNPETKVRLVNPAGQKSIIEGIAMSVSRNMKTGIADIEILTS